MSFWVHYGSQLSDVLLEALLVVRKTPMAKIWMQMLELTPQVMLLRMGWSAPQALHNA
jgi:hypothetical protein